MGNITVCIGTYGDDDWRALAAARAIPSAQDQAPVVYVHGDTLAQARNLAIEAATTEWVVCLDADDELSPGYIDAMTAAQGRADLLGPAVSYVRRGEPGRPKLWPIMDLRDGNMLVIGTAVRREMVLSVGGFEEWPLYEDWAVWSRCAKGGATVAMIEDAIYLAHVRPGSRNREPDPEARRHWHHEIRRTVWPELYASELAPA